MKKNFTLKAAALGVVSVVALTASAAPAEFLLKKAPAFSGKISEIQSVKAPTDLKMKIGNKMVVKSADDKMVANRAAKAPAKRAAANWGAWEAAADGNYTFTQLAEGSYEFKYQRRFDSANEGNLQVKVNGWGLQGAGNPITFDIEKMTVNVYDDNNNVTGTTEALIPLINEPVYTGVTFDVEGVESDVYMSSYYTFLKLNKEAGNLPSTVTDEIIESYKDAAQYDEVEGKIVFLPKYFLYQGGKPTALGYKITDDNDNLLLEQYQMTGNGYKNYDLDVATTFGYFSHEKDATSGKYTVDVTLNDNAMAMLRIAKTSGTSPKDIFNAMLSDFNKEDLSDLTVVKQSGTVEVPVSAFSTGRYYLVCAFTDGIADGEGMVNMAADAYTLVLSKTDADYYSVGEATFTDADMSPAFQMIFGEQLVPDEPFVSTVPIQASASKPGIYRLIHPHAEMYKTHLVNVLDYAPSEDILEFECNNYNKVNIRPSGTGFLCYMTDDDDNRIDILIQTGSTNQFENSDNTESKDLWGKYSNGVVSFPAPTAEGNQWGGTEASALSLGLAVYSAEGAEPATADNIISLPYPDETKIEFTVAAGVKNVAADLLDENAPVEYFNLQGIRVANPEAGQLLIKKQGAKAQKLIIR